MSGRKSYFSINGTTLNQGATGTFTYAYDEVDSKVGIQLPMHKSLIQMRSDATTALDGTIERYSVSSYPYMTGRDPSLPPGVSEFYSNNWGSPLVVKSQALQQYVDASSLYSGASAKALSAAQNQIQNFVNPVAGQVMLGELKETLALLRNPFGASVKLLAALSKAKGLKHAVADSWLEFRFGILPLISDIKAILEVVQREVLRDECVRFKAYAKSAVTYNDTQDYSMIYGTVSDRFLKWSWTVEDVYHFGILASKLDRASSLSESVEEFLSPKYILPTAWELIPFSFLVDYFSDVGDIISAVSTGRFDTSYCSHSVILTKEATFSFSAPRRKFNNAVIVDPSPTPVISYKLRSLTRRQANLGIPPLVFHLPGSSVRYFNIAALLASLKHK